MGIVKHLAKKSSRKSLKSSASVLALAAGAVGWSGLAQAASEETGSQLMLVPEHYELMQDGVVVFSLQTGEQLTLNPGQYVILQDGLLLITDELAQASMDTLPVMGSIRAQLTSELQPVRSPDGSVVQASDASPLWSGDGPAPRLFEEVDIQRYELAQNSSESQTQSGGNLGQAAGAAAGGLSLVGLSLTKGVFGTKPEQTTEESPAPTPPPEPEFLSNTAFQALTPASARVFTGSAANSFIGYSAATPTAQDPLVDAGKGAGNSATFDMSAGGDNLLLVASYAAASSGSLSYTGGSGKDDLAFGEGLGSGNGSAVIIAGGDDNTLNAGDGAAAGVGALSYTGGDLADSFTFGSSLGAGSGTVTLNAGNGDNILTVGSFAAGGMGSLSYTGGSGKDDLAFGTDLGSSYGSAVIIAGGGDNTLNAGSGAVAGGGTLSYTGGDLADSFTFDDGLGAGGGTVTLNAGNGDNILTAGSAAAKSSGSFSYTGGSGKDDLAFGESLGATGGSAVIDAGGGDNTLNAGDAAVVGGALTYTGGDLADSFTFGGGLGAAGGSVILNAGNGDNILTADGSAAYSSGEITYTGGSGKDDLAFGDNLGADTGTVTLNVGNGDNTLNAGSGAAEFGGTLIYNGGTGSDVLTLANGLAYFGNSTVQLDLGDDSSYDAIAFTGSVAGSATNTANYVKIINYDVTNDAITATSPIDANDFRLDGNDIHWERSSDIYITFEGLGPDAANISISALTDTISA